MLSASMSTIMTEKKKEHKSEESNVDESHFVKVRVESLSFPSTKPKRKRQERERKKE